MNSNLIPWVRKPFTILSNPNGYVGDRIYTASYLGISDRAAYTIIKVLGVSNTLTLSQSDYWIESISDGLTLAQTAGHEKQRPLSASDTMALTGETGASGGQTGLLTVHTAKGCGYMYAGQPIYVKEDGYLMLAVADMTAAKAGVAGIVYSDSGGVICGDVQFMTDGELELDDWTNATGSSTLTPGAAYYLSGTEGVMTTTPPSTTGEYVVKVGRAVSKRIFAIDLGEGVRL